MKDNPVRLLATLLLGISTLATQAQGTAPQQTTPSPPPTTLPTTPQQAPATPKPADLPLPNDPKEILELAAKTNGLGGNDLKPWHLKASFETYDDKGKSENKGTLEVFWASPSKYKRIYNSTNYNEVEYQTDHGIYRSGNVAPPSYAETIIVDQLLHPLPSQSEIDEFSPEKREQNFGKVKLQCVMLSQKIVRLAYAPLGLFPTYCFSPEKPVLRFGTFSGGVQVIFNKLALFQGRYFAQQIAISDRTIALADISVDSLTGIPAIKSEDFDPPQNAVKGYESPQGVSAGVMAGRIARKTQPIYPQSAKANRISGKVLLDATIGRDGRIHRLKVVSSPDPDLSIASLAAVQQWSYQPYLLMGEPVEVNTQITVVFALGPR